MPGPNGSKMHKMQFLQNIESSEGDRHVKRHNFIIIWCYKRDRNWKPNKHGEGHLLYLEGSEKVP